MTRRSPWTVGFVLGSVLVGGCASLIGADFDHPPAVDGSLDGAPSELPDGDGPGADGGASVVPPDGEGKCSSDRKLCDGQCASKSVPDYGCEGASCTPCSVGHGAATCRAGACAIGTCDGAWRDCNGSLQDGCEVDTSSDGDHCGACGQACESGKVCSNGVCSASCASSARACGKSCVDTQSDPGNCGDCANACSPVTNGVATCQGGSCGFTCNAGFHACGSACVVESPTSCGTSCTVCKAPDNGVSTCSGGACDFVCKTGYNRSGSGCVLAQPSDTWQTVAPLLTARGNLAAAVAKDGRIFAIGGWDGAKVLSTVEAYNPKTNTWQTVAPMPTARQDVAAVTAQDGRIFVIGGYDGNSDLSTVEVYDPSANTWTAVTKSLHVQRSALAATVAKDGRIFAIGGFDGLNVQSAVEVYDPTTAGDWSYLKDLPLARSSLASVTALDGRIYAFGGAITVSTDPSKPDSPSYWDVSPENDSYDPTTKVWTQIKSLNPARGSFGAATAKDGRIFLVGGVDAGNTLLSKVESFDPTSVQFKSVKNVGTPRSNLAAVTGQNGRIYAIGGTGFVGGNTQLVVLSVVEAYSP